MQTFKKYEYLFYDTLLIDIDPEEINAIIGKIKKEGKLKDSTLRSIKNAIVQALNFASKYNIIDSSLTSKIVTITGKSEKKEIFTNSELDILFNAKKNPFGTFFYQLFNEVLFKTGCRVGEIQALQINDLIKNENGYCLNISKNYSNKTNRLKETKTGRSDLVAISTNTAERILNLIKKNPYKKCENAFIFFSTRKDQPINYSGIRKNFDKTIKTLGFKRKNLTMHSYRHTYATKLLDNGISELELMYLTRHDDIKQAIHYSSHDSKEKELKRLRAAQIMEGVA